MLATLELNYPRFSEALTGAELLGQGGWGDVYGLADQPVAVKFLSAARSSDDDRFRFEREFALAHSLQHPGLVKVYEKGEWEGRPYYTMEKVEGVELLDYLKQHPTQLQPLFIQLLEVVGYIHEKGVLHRDLKPENILVQPDGTLRLLDFGVARPLEETRHTRTGVVLGTPAYMSPEQIQGQELDRRSDLYSIGVILYEALERRLPFESRDVGSMLYRILNDEPTPVKCSGALACLTRWLMQKRRDERPASAAEALDFLRRPHRPSCWRARLRRLGSWSRSPWTPFLAGLATGAALLGFIH